jgi:hypothetical protein
MRAGAKAGERPARWWQSQESVNLTLHPSSERHKRAGALDPFQRTFSERQMRLPNVAFAREDRGDMVETADDSAVDVVGSAWDRHTWRRELDRP